MNTALGYPSICLIPLSIVVIGLMLCGLSCMNKNKGMVLPGGP